MEQPSKGRARNKVRTYLFYAIGEIALVMIGILLALQVNNWNEERKLMNEEQIILNALHEELTGKQQIFRDAIKRARTVEKAQDIYLEFIMDAGRNVFNSRFNELWQGEKDVDNIDIVFRHYLAIFILNLTSCRDFEQLIQKKINS